MTPFDRTIRAARIAGDECLMALRLDVAQLARAADTMRYAALYLAWRLQPESGPLGFDLFGGPEDPVHKLKLTYMVRQSVRVRIDAIFSLISSNRESIIECQAGMSLAASAAKRIRNAQLRRK